jgi:hypothetical protein
MLLRMLNQHRPPLAGIRPATQQGHSSSYGRGWAFNQQTIRPTAQGLATTQQDVKPTQIPPTENWDSDDSDIILL